MRIYLAAKYGRRKEMQKVATDLRALGHDVLSSWVDADNDALDKELRNLDHVYGLAAKIAVENFREIEASECLVSFTEYPSTLTMGGGRHVELGMAIALLYAEPHVKRRIITVGPPENLFCHMDVVERHDLWAHALAAIGPAPIVARGGV